MTIHNKSTGPDGFIPDAYQLFWRDLKIPCMNMTNELFYKGVLPETARKSAVTFFFKKGDKRLISELQKHLNNYDYKILYFFLPNDSILLYLS